MDLKKRVALVTGAGQGIGQAIALAFAKEGAKVVVNDVNDEGMADTEAKVRSLEGECLGVKADVSRSDEVKTMMDRILARYGTLDILVNNAGIVRGGATEDHAEEDWDAVIAVDLKGVFLCSKYAARIMIPRKSGCIINISSVAAHEPGPGIGAYNAAKAGVIAFTKQCAIEWGRHNIRVNSISPGLIWTSINPAYQDPEVRKAREGLIPLGRLGNPDDIASVAVMLASEGAGYITGCDVQVDGGFLRNMQTLLPGRIGVWKRS